MNFILFFIVTAVMLLVCKAKITVKDRILQLDDTNFELAVSHNEFLFVKFYAPWCRHSITMATAFIKAAEKAAQLKLPVKFAQLDASKEREIGDRYHIRSYPKLKLFTRGLAVDYLGPRMSKSMVAWIQNLWEYTVIQEMTIDQPKYLSENDNIVFMD